LPAVFDITPGMEPARRDLPKPKATAADIAMLEGALDTTLPPSDVEFVSRHGFAAFGRDPEGRCVFQYAIEAGSRVEMREGDISFLFRPEKLLQVHRYMISIESPDDEARPMIPPGYLAVGSDAGHGCIPLDIAARRPGQVWYWRASASRWGLDANVALGFVADDLEGFINNGLRSDRP
jgi:hypothetical protein